MEQGLYDILSTFGYDYNTPMITGSALCALEDRNPEIGLDSVKKLLEVVDSYIPTPPRDLDKPFLMSVGSVYSIAGQGTVVTGRIERGVVKKGDEVQFIGHRSGTKTVVTGLEMFHKTLDRGEAGDNLGALVRGVKRDEVKRGVVLCAPGSVTSHSKFQAEVYILKKEEGGRHTPFFRNYTPQMYFRTGNVPATITPPEEIEMLMPGDNANLSFELMWDMPLEVGLRFILREGNKTVGTGVVTKLVD